MAVIFIQMERPLYDSMSFCIFTGCTNTDMSGRQVFCFPDKKRNSPSHTCALFTTHSVKPELPSIYPSYRQKQVIRGSPVLYVIAVASTFQCTKLKTTLEIPIIHSCSIRIFYFLKMLFPYYSARKGQRCPTHSMPFNMTFLIYFTFINMSSFSLLEELIKRQTGGLKGDQRNEQSSSVTIQSARVQ